MYPTSKQALRKIYREKRINLSIDQYQSLNRALVARVETLDVSQFATIHLFLPIEGNREPDTRTLAQSLKRKHPHIRLVLPRTAGGSFGLQHVVWNENTTLSLNHWGIPEPEGGTAVAPQEVDAVFVPLLAFDTRGNRVGYGKGFYDRFLAECRPETAKIGLSLFDAEPAITGIDAYDIPLDACVTPYRIWHFNTTP
ncbi:5-formyltetrahydrofolate cyclo-ligase [Parapedobacter deserti]|uniref:5-formyltetrahydrofolate cyclo-ligase n=1 Tax=Parapedobacter deserti TaxID=1912957 RepID=A0ABV7JVH3_9SPHI